MTTLTKTTNPTWSLLGGIGVAIALATLVYFSFMPIVSQSVVCVLVGVTLALVMGATHLFCRRLPGVQPNDNVAVIPQVLSVVVLVFSMTGGIMSESWEGKRQKQAQNIGAVAPVSPWLALLDQYPNATGREAQALDAQLAELDDSTIGIDALEAVVPFRSLPQSPSSAAILEDVQRKGNLSTSDRVALVKHASSLPLTMEQTVALASLR